MPINPDSKIALAVNISTNKAMANKKYSKSSYLILKDATGYNAYIMTIIADSTYLKGDLSKIAHNSYSKRDTDFSGVVLYFTPKGSYVNGYTYHKGHLVTSASATASVNKTNQSTAAKKQVTELEAPTGDCTDWYIDTYYGDELLYSVYIGTTCDNGDDTGGGGSPGSDDGNNGGSTPAPPQCPPAGSGSGDASVAISKRAVTVAAPVNTPDDGGDDEGGFPPPAQQPPPCTVAVQDSICKDSSCVPQQYQTSACLSSFKFSLQGLGPSVNTAVLYGSFGDLVDSKSGQVVVSAYFTLEAQANNYCINFPQSDLLTSQTIYAALWSSHDINSSLNSDGTTTYTFSAHAQAIIARDAADYAATLSNQNLLNPSVGGVAGQDAYRKQYTNFFSSYLSSYIPGSRAVSYFGSASNATSFTRTSGSGVLCYIPSSRKFKLLC